VRPWILVLVGLLLAPALGAGEPLATGSKKFTEGVILGEIAARALVEAGCPARHRQELGGTRVVFAALEGGEIDAYAEYTGTLVQEIFKDELTPGAGLAEIRRILRDRSLAERGLMATDPLGFNNTYALAMRPERADELGVETISDLVGHPELRLGLTNEFLNRGDGWPSLRQRYGLPQDDVRGLDHDLAYRALEAGDVDVIDVYTTDAEIAYYDLRVLDDDLGHFPAYEALYLYRAEIPEPCARALEDLAGTLDAGEMQRLNARVKLEGETEARVAADFVGEALNVEIEVEEVGLAGRLARRTWEHLGLVSISLLGAILLALPLGVAAAKWPRWGQAILGLVGVIQTVPALALLVFMIPLLGIGGPPAIAALFLYSLLPIVRNTHQGLVGIPRPIAESAEALGLPARARLSRVELPLALPSILAGIKTSAVINVGFATLGALIGAGGYGQPILTGIRLDDLGLILEGAVPAALLALVVQGFFDLAERYLVPRGLRR